MARKKPYHKHDVVIGRIFAFVRVLPMEVIIYVECRCFFFERNLLFSRTEGLSGYDYELKTKNEKYKFSNYLCPILTNRAKISDQSINVNEYRVSYRFLEAKPIGVFVIILDYKIIRRWIIDAVFVVLGCPMEVKPHNA